MYYLFEHDGVICTRADLIEYLWDNRLYSDTSYHNEELKSLTRYRFDKVKERAKLKSSVSRLVCILFPELERLVPTLHMASVYCFALLDFQVHDACCNAHLIKASTYSLIVRKADMERYCCHVSWRCKKFYRFSYACQVFETKAHHKTYSGISDWDWRDWSSHQTNHGWRNPIANLYHSRYQLPDGRNDHRWMIGDFSRFIPQIRYSHMQECLPPLINPDS